MIQQIGLFPHRTIGDNIATVPRLLGWDKKRISARVEELLDLIGLPQEMAARYPAQLSGGQRQRVGVARALAADPPLMLMDEPFGAIDPINRERLQNEFLRLQAEIRKTIVFVTHDIDEAIKMGDRIAILQVGGKLAQYAPPAELLLNPANPFVEDFVGADRALKRLALQRRRRDVPRRSRWRPAPRRRRRDRGRRHRAAAGRRRGARAAGCRARAGRRAVASVRSPEPIVELDDICATRSRPAGDARVRAWSTTGREAGVLSIELLGHELQARTDRQRPAQNSCVEDNGFCPQLDRPQLRPLQDAADRAHRADADRGGDRLRDRVLARAAAHRRRWLVPPITQITGILYTLPSVAVFFLLLPLTGRGNLTALIALVAYTLLIIFRNVITGLDGVPAEARDAGRGMGLTPNQLLWKVELPLALPEIMAGLRIAVTTTVGLTALVFLAGAGGLGDAIFADLQFRSNVVVAGGLCVLLAVVLDLLVLALQKALTPWTRAAHDALARRPGRVRRRGQLHLHVAREPARLAGRRRAQPAAAVGAPEAVPGRDGAGLGDRAAARARTRPHRQVVVPGHHDVQRRPRRAERRADRALHRVLPPQPGVPERDARARPAGDPADPHQRLRGRAADRSRRGRRRARHGPVGRADRSARSSSRWRCR